MTKTRLSGFLAILLLGCTLAYLPGLKGAFILDDYHVIANNPAVHPASLSWQNLQAAATSTNAGPLGRPVSMVSFALVSFARGPEATPQKQANLILHGICAGLLMLVANALARAAGRAQDARLIGLLAAGIWALHPLQVSTVLYVSQRMTILATLFSLLSLLQYLLARRAQMERGRSGLTWFAGAALSAAAASLAKETGLLTPLFWLLTEIYFLRFRAAKPSHGRVLQRLYLLGASAVFLAVAFVLWRHGSAYVLDGYARREFTFSERVLTQFRVLCLYLQMLAFPNLASMTLYHDDIRLSHGLLSPWTTLSSLLFLASLLALAWFRRRPWPWACFAIALFFVGHALESTIFALEIAYEHRNYLPSTGFAMAAALGLIHLGRQLPKRRLVGAGMILPIVVLAGLTLVRTQTWGTPFEMLKHNLQHHPDSPRTQLWAGDTFMQLAAMAPEENGSRYRHEAKKHYLRAHALNRSHISGLIEAAQIEAQLDGQLSKAREEQLCQELQDGILQSSTLYTLQEAGLRLRHQQSSITVQNLLHWSQCGLANAHLRLQDREFLQGLQRRWSNTDQSLN